MTGSEPDILVNIDVDDLERAIAFYRDGLGLRLGRRLFGGEVAEMLGASARVFLLQKEAGSLAIPGRRLRRAYRRHWTPVHLDIVVPDLSAAIARAEAAGARREGEVRMREWGAFATFADPFGHGFCLLQFHHGDYDESAA